MAEIYFVGVDVGTGSCRAVLVDSTGRVHKVHVKETKTWNPLPDHYEQSSDNIWQGICECVQVFIENFYYHYKYLDKKSLIQIFIDFIIIFDF